jgi:hypothetical protein
MSGLVESAISLSSVARSNETCDAKVAGSTPETQIGRCA